MKSLSKLLLLGLLALGLFSAGTAAVLSVAAPLPVSATVSATPLLVAQVSPPAAADLPPSDPVGPDIAAAKVYGVPVAAILSLVTTFVVAGVKALFNKFGAKIPVAIVPLVALVVSYGLDWLSHFTFGTDSNGLLALGAGLAAVGLNQLKKQFAEKPAGPVNLGG